MKTMLGKVSWKTLLILLAFMIAIKILLEL